MKRVHQLILAVVLLLFSLSINFGCFSFHGKPDGIYLLKGSSGKLFELKDDILLGEYERLIAKIEFQAFYERWRSKEKAEQGRPYLKYRWSAKDGRGYFISFFPDGTKFLTCFGRYVDDNNNHVRGLFAGGGLPRSHYENAALKTNETGSVAFDGKEWHHLQRKTEEAIFSAYDPSIQIKPGQWEFLNSEVLFASQFLLALKSSHLAKLGTISVRMDRYLIYHAGDRFFTLVNRLTNSGAAPIGYNYTSGNEPFTGDFRSPADNRGWKSEASIALLPGRDETVVLTIGMANNDPETGSPRKSSVNPDPEELRFFLSR